MVVYGLYIKGSLIKLFRLEDDAWSYIENLSYLDQCEATVVPVEIY